MTLLYHIFNMIPFAQVFCWMGPHGDETTGWFGMTMEDIRRIEAETKKRLDEERSKGEKRGHVQAAEES